MKRGYSILICFFLLFPVAMVSAAELELGGELKQVLVYHLNQGLERGESIYQLEVEKGLGLDGKLYLALEGEYNQLTGKSQLGLGEAYTAVYLENVDLTLGRQVINWGTADGINPTNSINPVDLNSFILGELKGEPVLALQSAYYGEQLYLTGVAVFDYLPQDLALGVAELPGEIKLGKEPENTPDNFEYALKAETSFGHFDWQLSYFRGWDDLPALIYSVAIDPLLMQPVAGSEEISGIYRRLDKIGLAASGTINSAGLWGEAAYAIPEEVVIDKRDPLKQQILLGVNEPYIQAVIGSDYTLENGLYLQGQYLYHGNGLLFNPYQPPDQEIKASQYLIGRLSYEIGLNGTIESTAIFPLDQDSVMIIPVYTHALTQVTALKIGGVFGAGEGDEFEALSRQLILTLQTSF